MTFVLSAAFGAHLLNGMSGRGTLTSLVVVALHDVAHVGFGLLDGTVERVEGEVCAR